MVTTPEDTPITVPDDDPTVAIPVLPLVQIPPLTELVKTPDEPAQIAIGPGVIATGPVFTVTEAVATQVPIE